ncbi:hypothetical protein B9Z55_000484 [Caenorhabditis nigoni]|uniref:Uncharacterized protein n=1 Tax=Caenorhabditis nigoni TaxID=1611254 RepID=A0A2G5VTP5_9PELO|nr:hypothetical protein B9Z55_000484 [Caenorhabditis nigoni]
MNPTRNDTVKKICVRIFLQKGNNNGPSQECIDVIEAFYALNEDQKKHVRQVINDEPAKTKNRKVNVKNSSQEHGSTEIKKKRPSQSCNTNLQQARSEELGAVPSHNSFKSKIPNSKPNSNRVASRSAPKRTGLQPSGTLMVYTGKDDDPERRKLLIRCVKRYGRYSNKCITMERRFSMSPYQIGNRLPVQTMIEKLEEYSVNELRSFIKEQRKRNAHYERLKMKYFPNDYVDLVDLTQSGEDLIDLKEARHKKKSFPDILHREPP